MTTPATPSAPATPPPGGDRAGDATPPVDVAPIDQQRLQAEIDAEVRRRRADGSFPPGLERELDEVFARFAPVGHGTGDFAEALEQADVQSYFHVDVPTASSRPLLPLYKQLVKKALGWYLRFLAQQATAFGAAIVRAVQRLGERVDAIEAVLPEADPEVAAQVRRLSPRPDASRWGAALARAAADRSVRGRLLVAECGDASLVGALGDAGLDAYGVEPDEEAAISAARAGLDVRDEEGASHLRSLPDASLAGVVLAGIVDRSSLPVQRELAALAAAKVRPGGLVAVLGTGPARWARDQGSTVAADLAGGRPLHPETWAHLLSAAGCEAASVEVADEGDALEPVPSTTPGAEVLNANLARLNAALFGPASYLVTATRGAGRTDTDR